MLDENYQPQVHVRCSDVNVVCETRNLVSLADAKLSVPVWKMR